MPSPFSPDDLLTLYKIAIDEYRFEVKLNWDRTVYYLTLNSGLVAIATGLLKLGSIPVINLLVAAIFFIGLCTALIGWWGIQADPVEILNDTDAYLNRRIRLRSITFWVLVILVFFGMMDLAGMAGSVWLYYHPQSP